MNLENSRPIIVTAGSTYLDIDAYACCVALAELLQKQGKNAIAYSEAPCNYSVCPSLTTLELLRQLPDGFSAESANYIIVDVSDPEFLKQSVPLEQVTAIYDHHPGFENYWQSRIGAKAYIRPIGAAATLIYRAWKEAGLEKQMSSATARLLVAAILDNTLNLTSGNTTGEDVATFEALCQRENIDKQWCVDYFSQVQTQVERDLKHALLRDVKTVAENPVLPPRMGQLCVWDARRIFARLSDIRTWFSQAEGSWMANIIDIQQNCSYFLCDDLFCQKKMEQVFGVLFEKGIARTQKPWLRKEIIKKAIYDRYI